jgi:hypothetical protein
MFKFSGTGFVMVKNPNGGVAHQWPVSWQNCGIKFSATCHYCGKPFKGISDFRNNWQCRKSGGKVVGRITPVLLGNGKIRVSPADDHEHWDFVCKDCEPARQADWCQQQGIPNLRKKK